MRGRLQVKGCSVVKYDCYTGYNDINTKSLTFHYLWNVKAKTKNITLLIRNYVNVIDPTAEVILYGSRARGDERQDSDWDILILTDYPSDLMTERKFRDKLYDLELETGETFSVFVYSKNDWQRKQRITPFYHNVSLEGVRI